MLLCYTLSLITGPKLFCWLTPTTSYSTRLFACLITCYIPSFRRHLTHHNDTVCENERIYCNYLIIAHTCQTKIVSPFISS